MYYGARGVVGLVKPTYRPGSMESFIKLMPDGVGFIPAHAGIRAGNERELQEALTVAERKVARLAELGADVVMMLRIQRERHGEVLFPTIQEYADRYCLTRERLRRAKAEILVMHPGPMNRGVEISPDVADGLESVILQQVTNGVAVRMALLYLIVGGN